MILIDILVVLSKLFALIKFIVTFDCDVNSHLFFLLFFPFRHFRRNSANFSAKCLFGKVAFRQNGFSAKCFSAECRATCKYMYSTSVLFTVIVIRVSYLFMYLIFLIP